MKCRCEKPAERIEDLCSECNAEYVEWMQEQDNKQGDLSYENETNDRVNASNNRNEQQSNRYIQ